MRIAQEAVDAVRDDLADAVDLAQLGDQRLAALLARRGAQAGEPAVLLGDRPGEHAAEIGDAERGEQASEGRLAGREIPEERWNRLEALQRFADERGVPLLEVAIGGLLAMPAIACVIAGATKPEHVRANVRAGAWEPSSGDDVAALRAIS